MPGLCAVVASAGMDGAQALADLTEISAQIEAAVLADHDGSLVASTLGDEKTSKSFGAAAAGLPSEASALRSEPGSEPLVQVQGPVDEGSIFVAKDDRHLVAA